MAEVLAAVAEVVTLVVGAVISAEEAATSEVEEEALMVTAEATPTQVVVEAVADEGGRGGRDRDRDRDRRAVAEELAAAITGN